jgi:hypothetical protein
MSESTNSNHSELTKEQKEIAYKGIISLDYASTDLDNCRTNLENGKFYRAMDVLNEGIINLKIGIAEYKKFVKELQKENFWN